MATFEQQITAGTRDAERNGATWSPVAETVRVGIVEGDYEGYLQFAPALLAGATLHEAWLELVPAADATGELDTLVQSIAYVSGDLSTNAAASATVIATADVELGPWTTGEPARIDVTSQVAAWLAREDYAASDLLTLAIKPDLVLGMRTWHAVDGASASAPRLHLRWYIGQVGRVECLLQDLLADAAAFRAWVGATDRLTALRRIHYDAVDIAQATPRPCVLIRGVGDGMADAYAGTQRRVVHGSAQLAFIASIGTPYIDANGDMDPDTKHTELATARDQVSAVMRDVAALGQSAGYLAVGGARGTGEGDLMVRSERAQRRAANVPVDVEIPATILWGANAA